MTQEDDVFAAIKAHTTARINGEVDAVIDSHSEDWEDNKGYRKKNLKDGHLAFTTGALKTDISVDLSQTEISITDDRAVCGPVVVSTQEGELSYRYTLKKETDGVWRLVYTQTLAWKPASLDALSSERQEQAESLARTVRQHRETLLKDPFRPAYHFVIPEGVAFPFDPNGAIFWKGRYHLFYIFQDRRSGEQSDHWGHVSSTDLFHWRHHPTGLLEGMYSGNCFINGDGIPTICYHQVDQGNALAVALDDNLDEWHKLATNPITPKTQKGDEHHGKYRSWDPFGWYDGDTYYAIFGGERPAVAKSEHLEGEWHYIGDLFAHGLADVSLAEDVSCAELFKLGDRDLLLCISHRLGCRYYVGEWKNEQFYPESHSLMSWGDNGFFAPESLQDEAGRRIMWAWLLDSEKFHAPPESTWSGTLSLPRVLSMHNGTMQMDVPKEIEALRYRPWQTRNLDVKPGNDLVVAGVTGNCLELDIQINTGDASACGVKVCQSPDGREETVIVFDVHNSLLTVNTQKSGPLGTPKNTASAPFSLEAHELLRLRVFVDKSVVEVFANNRQVVTRRIYPSLPESVGISLFCTAEPCQITTFSSWQLSPANPY